MLQGTLARMCRLYHRSTLPAVVIYTAMFSRGCDIDNWLSGYVLILSPPFHTLVSMQPKKSSAL